MSCRFGSSIRSVSHSATGSCESSADQLHCYCNMRFGVLAVLIKACPVAEPQRPQTAFAVRRPLTCAHLSRPFSARPGRRLSKPSSIPMSTPRNRKTCGREHQRFEPKE